MTSFIELAVLELAGWPAGARAERGTAENIQYTNHGEMDSHLQSRLLEAIPDDSAGTYRVRESFWAYDLTLLGLGGAPLAQTSCGDEIMEEVWPAVHDLAHEWCEAVGLGKCVRLLVALEVFYHHHSWGEREMEIVLHDVVRAVTTDKAELRVPAESSPINGYVLDDPIILELNPAPHLPPATE